MRKIFLSFILFAASPAFAHPGHATEAAGFLAGLLHPLSGLDHLLAMLAVGLWSATHSKRIYLAPLVFVVTLLAGALLAQAGLQLPLLEPVIAASVLVLGVLLALRRKLPSGLSLLLLSTFALFHGAAHGVELAADAALAGMVLATLALHIVGVVLGLQMRTKSRVWQSVTGFGIALAGGGLAFNTLVGMY